MRQTPEQSDIGCDALRNMTKKHKRKCWDGASRAIAPFCRYFSSPSPPKADHSRIQETRYHVSPHQRNLEYFQFPTVQQRASVDTSVRDSRRRKPRPAAANKGQPRRIAYCFRWNRSSHAHDVNEKSQPRYCPIGLKRLSNYKNPNSNHVYSYCTYCYSVCFLQLQFATFVDAI